MFRVLFEKDFEITFRVSGKEGFVLLLMFVMSIGRGGYKRLVRY